ncbi:hypothetical protein ABZ876_36255 [Streptomyces sp. NPDC046931]|uniref:TetR/AcrR family transcriptional regulator n=1 Tax=Streptomyces sp. NPDC046931 TaxID=3154806 RepID=UPI0033DE2315
MRALPRPPRCRSRSAGGPLWRRRCPCGTIRPPRRSCVRSSSPQATNPSPERLRAVFSALVLQVVSASLPDDEAGLRSDLVATQIVGLAMTRYVWAVDRIADMPREQVVRLIGPVVQHYLTGTLGGDVSEGA